ncbi:MAG: acyl carrier protein [Chloroflexota bacterium]
MSQEAIQHEVLRVLREDVLLGSDRAVDLDAPLGPGVGLDSLALMEFLGALEGAFEVEFPETLWSDRSDFTLRRLIEYLVVTSLEPGSNR